MSNKFNKEDWKLVETMLPDIVFDGDAYCGADHSLDDYEYKTFKIEFSRWVSGNKRLMKATSSAGQSRNFLIELKIGSTKKKEL